MLSLSRGVVALCAALLLAPPAFAQSKDDVNAKINSALPDNARGQITAQKLRDVINSLNSARGQPNGIAELGPDGRLANDNFPNAFTPNILKLPSVNQGSTGDVTGMSATLPEGVSTLGDAFASRQKVFRFDPRVYGATCNGSGTRDDTGINAAIAALQAAGGGTLHIPGKCVISQGKTVTGVPIVITGDGFGSSQLIGSASLAGGTPFLLRLDISGGSNLTATVTGVGFRTAQTEAVSALQIEGSVSGLEERAVVSDVEIRGTNVATAGFANGLQLKNVNGPKVSRVTITGRQTGNGPSGLTNMTACVDVVNTIGSMTNYAFSDVRCNAAKLGWNMNGYIEGVLCTRCFAIAVGTGWKARPGAIVPLLNISQSHADFFDAGVDVEQMAQGSYTANLFYHRNDSTGPGICYQMSNNSKQSSIIGGECYNASDTTSLIGVNWNNTSDSLVSDVIFRGLATGVTNTNGSSNNIYRRGILTENRPGFGEHGNGGVTSNICIGYNAAC